MVLQDHGPGGGCVLAEQEAVTGPPARVHDRALTEVEHGLREGGWQEDPCHLHGPKLKERCSVLRESSAQAQRTQGAQDRQQDGRRLHSLGDEEIRQAPQGAEGPRSRTGSR